MKKKRVGRHLIFMDNLIGKGSFSKVYRGIDQATEEQVAVKIITKDKSKYMLNFSLGGRIHKARILHVNTNTETFEI